MSQPVYRPLVQAGGPRPAGALPLAGGMLWFASLAEHRRAAPPRLVAADAVPAEVLERLSAPRPPICGLGLDRPRIMGVVNVTPDSFSDGGQHLARDAAIAHGLRLVEEGADLLDIGGESTRPGADPVPAAIEAGRVVPVIEGLRQAGVAAPISIDTRNAGVARAALDAGADLINDVSALSHDPGSRALAAGTGCPVALMHAKGDPKTMQDAPEYGDVLLEVHGFLADRVAAAEAAGIPRARILVDPGIGFGKTVAHNLALIRGLSILHDLGCGILFGASRKRFIGAIGDEPDPARRVPGSLCSALEAMRQGAQMIRVHDVKETRQALSLWWAVNGSGGED